MAFYPPSYKNRLLNDFFDKSGYGPSDLLAVNLQTRIVMTKNGGQYRVSDSGTVSRIKGPPVDPTERD